jgi:hypothetical protein
MLKHNTEFSKNPIRINILHRNGEMKQQIVFIGKTTPEIKKILQTYETTQRIRKQHETVLKAKYGAKWHQKLSIVVTGGGMTRGGITGGGMTRGDANDHIEKDDEIDVDRIIDITGDAADDNLVSIDDIYKIEEILKETETQNVEQPSNKPDKLTKTGKQPKSKLKYIFDEIEIYPFDTIFELKQKIANVTDIPIYKQNIWYRNNKKIFNLNYNIFLQSNAVDISLWNNIINVKDNMDTIDNIPILIKFYDVKNSINIKMYEPFSVIEDYINLGITEYNMFDFDDFVEYNTIKKLKNNQNQLEIIYYGLVVLFWPMFSYTSWLDWVNNPNDFTKLYPDLDIKPRKIYKLESEITDRAMGMDKEDYKQIDRNVFIGITNATIKINSPYNQLVINLRNLFDYIELNDVIVACKCSMQYDNKNLTVYKTLDGNTRLKPPVPANTILLKLFIDEITDVLMYLYPNGNIIIKSKWPDDKLYGFTEIFNIVSIRVNRVIDYIRGMNSTVIDSNYRMERMTIKNAKFSEINMSLVYRKSVSYQQFKSIEKTMQDYTDSNLATFNNATDNTMEYYFNKGMYIYNESRIERNFVINNYYLYLTNSTVKNKWQYLFQNTRNVIFDYRNDDIKITINGVHEEEFDIFYLYMVDIINQLSMIKDKKDTTNKYVRVKNIKTLKYQDPVLYDFKKLYNSPVVYSKICQKKHQPNILSQDELDKLNETDRGRVVEYWNFTTKSPVYYQCPNAKYPYLQFTVNKHPNGYCIPCCKIKPLVEVGESENKPVKNIIYEQCMKTHEYKSNAPTSDSKYIMVYGKPAFPGRLYMLPEKSIEPLFYESFSLENYQMETKCKMKYYILGMEQNYRYTSGVGVLTTVAYSLEKSVEEFLVTAIDLIKKTPMYYKTLLDGRIVSHFRDLQHMVTTISDTFMSSNPITQTASKIPWNDIFVDIAYYYFNIVSVIFDDFSMNFYENIKLRITNKMSIQNFKQLHRVLFLICKDGTYNPIYTIDTSVYFKTKGIKQMLYTPSDKIVQIIMDLLKFNTNNKANDKYNESSRVLDLDVYNKFVNGHKKYEITKYYINHHNFCYYIEVLKNKKTKIYVPVSFSTYTTHISDTMVDYNTFNNYGTKFSDINEFIRDLNIWIIRASKPVSNLPESKPVSNLPESKPVSKETHNQLLYTPVHVDKWIYLDNPWQSNGKKGTNPIKKSTKPVIGFICGNVNYYHEPITHKYAQGLKDVPFQRIIYHPNEINTNIDKTPTPDPRSQNITKNMYNYYLYELLIIEFITLMNQEKNLKLRHKIKKSILTTIDKDLDGTGKMIHDVVAEYYEKYNEDAKNNYSFNSDMDKLNRQINSYTIKHQDKKILLADIDATTYIFDQIQINELKGLPHNKIVQELMKLSKRIVTIGTETEINTKLIRVEDFGNIFVSCSDGDGMVYCRRDKLLITKEKLHGLIDIMANDILNPLRSKWLFNSIFSNNIINYLRFVKRPMEVIEIEMV